MSTCIIIIIIIIIIHEEIYLCKSFLVVSLIAPSYAQNNHGHHFVASRSK
jgi:hypothetical protein